ncbi:MAG: HEAT repeat domain-containing protein [Candidatus Omnitrophica bacterium]|nr:HEAT repeat domain-containing protein [Candidatus Omnitrophota bacterium]
MDKEKLKKRIVEFLILGFKATDAIFSSQERRAEIIGEYVYYLGLITGFSNKPEAYDLIRGEILNPHIDSIPQVILVFTKDSKEICEQLGIINKYSFSSPANGVGIEQSSSPAGPRLLMVRVKANMEVKVAQVLLQKGLQILLPVNAVSSRRKDRKKTIEIPAYPGYVFVFFTSEKDRLAVLRTIGIVSGEVKEVLDPQQKDLIIKMNGSGLLRQTDKPASSSPAAGSLKRLRGIQGIDNKLCVLSVEGRSMIALAYVNAAHLTLDKRVLALESLNKWRLEGFNTFKNIVDELEKSLRGESRGTFLNHTRFAMDEKDVYGYLTFDTNFHNIISRIKVHSLQVKRGIGTELLFAGIKELLVKGESEVIVEDVQPRMVKVLSSLIPTVNFGNGVVLEGMNDALDLRLNTLKARSLVERQQERLIERIRQNGLASGSTVASPLNSKSIIRISSNLVKRLSLFVVITLLFLSLVFNSSCGFIVNSRLALKHVAIAQELVSRQDYKMAMYNYYTAYCLDANSIKTPIQFGVEARKEAIRLFINDETRGGTEFSLDPKGFLKILGISKEELYDGYLKAFYTHSYEHGAFLIARGLAEIGDPSGHHILLENFKGDYSEPGYATPKEIREKLSILAAFSLAELGDDTGRDQLTSVVTNKELYDKNTYISALYYLGRINNDKTSEIFRNLISDSNDKVKKIAIWALSNRPDPEDYNLFVNVLNSDDAEIVKLSIAALAKLGDNRVVPKLAVIACVPDNKLEIRVAAILALPEFKHLFSLRALTRAAKDSEPKVRAAVAAALARFEETETFDLSRKMIDDKDASVRAQAILSIAGKINDKQSDINLITGLCQKDEDVNVKLACLSALSSVSTQKAKEVISGFISNSDWRLRYAAVTILSQYTDKDNIELIKSLLNDNAAEVQKAVILYLAEQLKDRPDLFNFLYNKQFHTNDDICTTTAIALASYVNDYPKLLDSLYKTLSDNNPQAKIGILFELSRIQGAHPVDMIKVCLNDRNPSVREAAILALGKVGTKEDAEILIPMLKDYNWKIRKAAIISLVDLDRQQAINHLKSIARDENPFVRMAVAQAFCDTEEAPSTELGDYLNDPFWQVRLAAVNSLQALSEVDTGISDKIVRLAQEDTNILVRSAATYYLGGFNTPLAINAIKENFNSHDWLLRQSAAQAAGKIGAPELIEPLKVSLEDKYYLVRLSAAHSLKDKIIQNPGLVDAFKPLLKDSNWEVRAAAVSSFKYSLPKFPEMVDIISPMIM